MTYRSIGAAAIGAIAGAVLALTIAGAALIARQSNPDPLATFQLQVREGHWERWCDQDTGAVLYRWNGAEGGVALLPDMCGEDADENVSVARVRR